MVTLPVAPRSGLHPSDLQSSPPPSASLDSRKGARRPPPGRCSRNHSAPSGSSTCPAVRARCSHTSGSAFTKKAIAGAIALFVESAAIAHEIGWAWWERCARGAAEHELELGNLDAAEDHALRSLGLSLGLGDRRRELLTAAKLAAIAAVLNGPVISGARSRAHTHPSPSERGTTFARNSKLSSSALTDPCSLRRARRAVCCQSPRPPASRRPPPVSRFRVAAPRVPVPMSGYQALNEPLKALKPSRRSGRRLVFAAVGVSSRRCQRILWWRMHSSHGEEGSDAAALHGLKRARLLP
jgi:hypothetical protein